MCSVVSAFGGADTAFFFLMSAYVALLHVLICHHHNVRLVCPHSTDQLTGHDVDAHTEHKEPPVDFSSIANSSKVY